MKMFRRLRLARKLMNGEPLDAKDMEIISETVQEMQKLTPEQQAALGRKLADVAIKHVTEKEK